MFAALDKAKLPNLANLDPLLLARVSPQDPGDRFAVVHTWGTVERGYNDRKVCTQLLNIPLDTWKQIFEPSLPAKLASCGINLIDEPFTVLRTVLQYLGRDLAAPTIIDTPGDICIALTNNGNFGFSYPKKEQRSGSINWRFQRGLCSSRPALYMTQPAFVTVCDFFGQNAASVSE